MDEDTLDRLGVEQALGSACIGPMLELSNASESRHHACLSNVCSRSAAIAKRSFACIDYLASLLRAADKVVLNPTRLVEPHVDDGLSENEDYYSIINWALLARVVGDVVIPRS